MVDMLPFPRITGDTPEKQIVELTNYLVQFKETLEFVLTNIDTDNLSPDLIKRLNELGADIEKSNVERENELAQISKNSGLTISDVCTSAIFSNAVKNEMNGITFTVNTETGHLEYSIQ